MMLVTMISAATLALTITVFGNVWSQRQMFYPSVVNITKSNPSMAVIYLQVDLFIIHCKIRCFTVLGLSNHDGKSDEESVFWPVEAGRVGTSD